MKRLTLTLALLTTGFLMVRMPRVLALLTGGSAAERISAIGLVLTAAMLWLALRFRSLPGGAPELPIVLGGTIAFVVTAAALFAPVISAADPIAIDVAQRLAGPTWLHPLGMDVEGRDVLSRLLHGLRTSLGIALGSMAIAMTAGTLVGLGAAMFPRADGPLMRLVDIGLAFPRVFLLLVLFAFWNVSSPLTIILILGLTGWYRASRLVRGEALRIKTSDYVTAGEALGLPPWRRLTRHLLPNVMAPIIVTTTLGIGNIMLIESGLAYLGVGVSEPAPSLGRMINTGTQWMLMEPRLALIPGLAITITVLSFSLLGDGLQHLLNPRSR